MSAPKHEQDEAVDWDYEKMANGVNVKFPPLDSSDVPQGEAIQHRLRLLRDVWNNHSRHWDVQDKIEIFDYLWSPSVAENFAWGVTENPLYSERSKFSVHVILKCLYPWDSGLGPHRFIRWGKYSAIDWDEHQATAWYTPQTNRWNASQDDPDKSLETESRATTQCHWEDAPSLAFDQQNNNTADGPSGEAVQPGSWDDLPVRQAWGQSQFAPPPDDQHYQRQSRSGWGSNNEKCTWGLPAANRIYAAPDLEYVESKEMAHQETSTEDNSAYSAWGYPRQSGRRACKGHNAFASKFSSETEVSEVGVITPASSNTEQAPVLSSQQIQELKDFITKTNNDTIAHLSLEMNHMKTSLEEKIERMREGFNLRLNRAMKVNRSLRDDMESLQLSLPDNAITQQQVRQLEAKVANLEQFDPDF